MEGGQGSSEGRPVGKNKRSLKGDGWDRSVPPKREGVRGSSEGALREKIKKNPKVDGWEWYGHFEGFNMGLT
jgi:hypothetical protein